MSTNQKKRERKYLFNLVKGFIKKKDREREREREEKKVLGSVHTKKTQRNSLKLNFNDPY
jgi:hypothetical protein